MKLKFIKDKLFRVLMIISMLIVFAFWEVFLSLY